MTITEFLEARLAEDEQLARDVVATVAPDEWENPSRWGNFFPADVAFWDSQTPARTLAEISAKREIMAEHAAARDEGWGHGAAHGYLWCVSCGSLDDSPTPHPCHTIRALASIYTDHPDYQQEWS